MSERDAAITVRAAAQDDWPEITRIYNHYVVETPITFDIEPFTVESRRPWLESFADRGPYRLLVAETKGSVLGYACSHRFRPKPAYRTSVEASIYLRPDATGRGLGARLYTRLFEQLADEDVHRVLAGVTLPNPASLALHRRFGFEDAGCLREVGRKFDRYWDVQWFQRALN